MSYVAQKKNRIIRIPEEKAEEYAKMGYEITNEDGEVVADAAIETIERAKEEITRLTKELGKAGTENEELKAKLTEATLYAEDADKKIVDLQKENEELKAAIQAQATMGSAAPVSEDSGKKKTTKIPKQTEKEVAYVFSNERWEFLPDSQKKGRILQKHRLLPGEPG